MDEFRLEQELRDIYYNPGTGYQSAERLYQKALDRRSIYQQKAGEGLVKVSRHIHQV